jgi:hypothetical protein
MYPAQFALSWAVGNDIGRRRTYGMWGVRSSCSCCRDALIWVESVSGGRSGGSSHEIDFAAPIEAFQPGLQPDRRKEASFVAERE